MQIPFHKPYITQDEIDEVVDSVSSGWLTMGPKTIQFEQEFKKYIGSNYAISCNSCTAALHLALRVIGLKEEDEVLVPAMTFAATAEVVCYFKAKPVLVDIDKDTHNIDINDIERKITSKTKAIIPVHYAGCPCNMDEILGIAQKYNLFVIEDAAHALPAWYKKRKIGTIGDITCFSFYATKTLATGEGGMITTENEKWSEKIQILRLHGISKDAWKRYSDEGSWYYEIIEAGYKYNFTDIQAALGLAQLKKLEWMRDKREEIANIYSSAFNEIDSIITPIVSPDIISAWHLYTIKLDLDRLTISRNQFIEELFNRGIKVSVHFIPLYRHPFYKEKFDYKERDFPNSEWVFNRVISLPIYPSLSKEEIEYIINNIYDAYNKYKR